MSLNAATGVISGTPTITGTYTVTLAAGNAGGTGHAVLTLTVAPPPEPTVVLSVAAPTVTINSGAVGEFLLTLSAVQAQDVVVAYVVKGTGVNGTDYVFLRGHGQDQGGPHQQTHQGHAAGATWAARAKRRSSSRSVPGMDMSWAAPWPERLKSLPVNR